MVRMRVRMRVRVGARVRGRVRVSVRVIVRVGVGVRAARPFELVPALRSGVTDDGSLYLSTKIRRFAQSVPRPGL